MRKHNSSITRALLVIAAVTAACAQPPDAAPPKIITGESYWYNKAFDRVLSESERGDFIVGVIQARHQDSPFRVRKSEAHDPNVIARGVKMTIAELINWLGTTSADWAQNKLQQLTGERLGRDQWTAWYRENAPYLAWSEDKQRLVIDQDAKQNHVPTEEYRSTRPWPQKP